MLIAAVVLSVVWLAGSSGAKAKGRHVQHAEVHHAGVQHDPGAAASLSPAQINANVNRLLNRTRVAEKFGQLEMAGPSKPDGSDLIPLAEQGEIGSCSISPESTTSMPYRPRRSTNHGSTFL
jgi:hypothetical protein